MGSFPGHGRGRVPQGQRLRGGLGRAEPPGAGVSSAGRQLASQPARTRTPHHTHGPERLCPPPWPAWPWAVQAGKRGQGRQFPERVQRWTFAANTGHSWGLGVPPGWDRAWAPAVPTTRLLTQPAVQTDAPWTGVGRTKRFRLFCESHSPALRTPEASPVRDVRGDPGTPQTAAAPTEPSAGFRSIRLCAVFILQISLDPCRIW